MAILLNGTGRSGTTWLANVINYDQSFNYSFEPLNYSKPDIERLFGRRKYLRPVCDNSKCISVLKEILIGSNFVKSVRAHLLMSWIYENLKKCKIIFLLRHPGAVALSWADRKWNSLDALRYIWNQNELLDDYPVVSNAIVKYKKSILDFDLFERTVLMWSIENYVAMDYLKDKDGWLLVYYEDLITDTINQIDSIFKFINRQYDKNLLLEKFKEPSPTCRGNSPVLIGEDPINAWKSYISKSNMENMIDILKMFPVKQFERYL